jgi:hypothetical protein
MPSVVDSVKNAIEKLNKHALRYSFVLSRGVVAICLDCGEDVGAEFTSHRPDKLSERPGRQDVRRGHNYCTALEAANDDPSTGDYDRTALRGTYGEAVWRRGAAK